MTDYEFWHELGTIYKSILAYQEKNIEFNRRFITPWIEINDVFNGRKNETDSLPALKNSAELDPLNASVWRDLGNAYAKAENFVKAEESFRKSLEIEPRQGTVVVQLGQSLLMLGRVTEAEKVLKAGIELLADVRQKSSVWNLLGDAYRKANDYDKALDAYRRADNLNSSDVGAASPKVPAGSVGKVEPAKVPAEFRSEVKIEKEAPTTPILPEKKVVVSEQALRGSVSEDRDSMILDDDDEDEDDDMILRDEYDDLILGDSDFPVSSNSEEQENFYLDLARDSENDDDLMLEDDDDEDDDFPLKQDLLIARHTADAVLNKAEVEEPVDDEEELPLGTLPEEGSIPVVSCEELAPKPIDQTDGFLPEALAGKKPGLDEFQAVIQSASVWNELGVVYFNNNALDKAVSAFSRAMEVDPALAWPYSNLALVYTKQEKYTQAIALYQRSIELFADDIDKAVTWNRLGNVYRLTEDYKNAVTAYQRADELDPANKALSTQSRFSLLGNLSVESQLV